MPEVINNQAHQKQRQYTVRLSSSEQAVYEGATRIFAAFVATGTITTENRSAKMKEAIQWAQELAYQADDLLSSEGEI